MRWFLLIGVMLASTGCSLLFHPLEQTQDSDGGVAKDGGVKDDGAEGETCGDTTCPVNGFCVTTGAGKVCQCADGFEGPECANINDCIFNACLNDGVCVDGVQSFTCDCTGNWTGFQCQEEICPSTTVVFASIISNCQSSPVSTVDVTISSTGGSVCVSSGVLGVGSDGFLDGNETLTFSFPEPVFLELTSTNALLSGETAALGTRLSAQVYSATWTGLGTFSPWLQAVGGTLDTLTLTAQNNGGRTLQSIRFWTACQASGN